MGFSGAKDTMRKMLVTVDAAINIWRGDDDLLKQAEAVSAAFAGQYKSDEERLVAVRDAFTAFCEELGK